MSTKQDLIEAIQYHADLTGAQAQLVYATYKNAKAVKLSVRGVELAHGRFLDRDVILRALSQAQDRDERLFDFDGQRFTADEMLATNAHDAAVCDFVRSASPGDTFCGCLCVRPRACRPDATAAGRK